MELKGEQIGKPVSDKLSDYLKKFTSEQDRAKASVESGVGFHTLKSLAIGRINITEANVVGLIELVKIAIEKCVTQAKEANVTKAKLQKLLKTA